MDEPKKRVAVVGGRRGGGLLAALAAAAAIGPDADAALTLSPPRYRPRQVFKTNGLGIEVPVKGMLEDKRRTNGKLDAKRRDKRRRAKASRKANR